MRRVATWFPAESSLFGRVLLAGVPSTAAPPRRYGPRMGIDTYEQITSEVRGDVVLLTLSRPEKLNVWTPRMTSELIDAIERGNDDSAVGAFVITGAGRGFCAGADVSAVFQARADGDETAVTGGERDWTQVVRDAKPIVAAINGPAIGLGLTLILSTDRIVAADTAKLSCRFVKMGITPELASTRWLVQRCGWGVASDLCLSGRTIDGTEAARIGLVDEVVPADDLLDTALARAAEYAANPSPQLRMIKRLLTDNSAEADLKLVQRREGEALAKAFVTPEHREAIAAFTEKRAPKFR